MLEFLLVLDEVGYDGWLTLDLVPKHESAVDACAQSILNLKRYLTLISRLDREALCNAQAELDAIAAQRIVNELLFVS
jgi:hypothetical protein